MIVRMKVMTRRAGFEHTHGFSGSGKRSLSWLLARQRTWADRTAIARYLGSRVPAKLGSASCVLVATAALEHRQSARCRLPLTWAKSH